MTRYCLDCGYSRQGLPKDAVCPECGEADSFEKQREVCAALASKPLSLLWRVMTLRRLPKGWWVVIEQERRQSFKSWQIILFGILLLSTGCVLGSFIWVESKTTTFLYDIKDPQRTVSIDESIETEWHDLPAVGHSYDITYLQTNAQLVGSNLRTGYKRSTKLVFNRNPTQFEQDWTFIGYLLVYTILVWLLSRFVWLPLITHERRASTFRNAARQTAVIYLAHVLWLIIVSLLEFLAILLASLISTVDLFWINMPFGILRLVILIFGAVIIWWRTISADTFRYVFPRRLRAGFLLVSLTLLASFAVFTWPWYW